jgi:hypothetical protein
MMHWLVTCSQPPDVRLAMAGETTPGRSSYLGKNMRFDLTTPCSNCPFRSDRPFPLKAERVRQILGGDRGRQWWPSPSFTCHKTVDYSAGVEGRIRVEGQHCAGVLIILTREERPNDCMQIAERLGLWSPVSLQMDAPVYHTTEEAVRGCARANGDVDEHAK